MSRRFFLALLLIFIGMGNTGIGKPVKQLTLSLWGFPHEVAQVRKWVKNFSKENPNLRVKILHTPVSQYPTKLFTLIAGGNPPDVALVNLVTFNSLVDRGGLLPLNEFIERDSYSLTPFYPQLVEALSFQGKIYGLPYIWNVAVLFYNKELFDKKGIDYPDENWDWEKLKKVARELTLQGAKGKVDQYGFCWVWGWGEPLVWQNGGEIVDETGKEFLMVHPKYKRESMEAMKFLFDLQKYGPYGGEGGVTPLQWFSMGKLAMAVSGTWWFMALDKYAPRIPWGVSVLPKGKKRATRCNVIGLVIPKGVKYPQDSWRLIKYLTQEEVEKDLAHTGKGIPCRKKVAENYYGRMENFKKRGINLQPILESLSYARIAEKGLHYRELDNFLRGKWDEVTLGNKSLEEVFQELEVEGSRILKGE